MFDMHELRVTYDGDLSTRTGLGMSSPFAVGMLNAFHALKGVYASKDRLAKEAIYLKCTLCSEAGGWQDQIAGAYGGFNKSIFKDETFEVQVVIIDFLRERLLDNNLMKFLLVLAFFRKSASVESL
jgi:D-glycero-alpha-D-manno-heptose-7-phosphate kinase